MVSFFKKAANRFKHHGKGSRWKRVILILLLVILVFAVVVVVFVSPITKYLVEKYDVQYTGREIDIGGAIVNPFTGSINFTDIKIFEDDDDSVFFAADNISLNLSLNKLFSEIYEINKLTLNEPVVKIVQYKREFNFTDLVKKFTSSDDTVQVADTTKEELRFNLLNVRINDGTIIFSEGDIPIDYSLVKVNIESEGIRWDNDSINTQFSFASGKGTGNVKGEFHVNTKSMNYRLASVIENLDLEILAQYLEDLSNYGSFKANLDADVLSIGNFNNADSVIMSGLITVKDFHFGKTPEEDYASFEKLSILMKEVSPMRQRYFIDSLSLIRPYFKYEQYDSLNNIETMFGQDGANIDSVKTDESQFNLVLELADYIKELSNNFFRSDFMIHKFTITEANLRYADYSLSEKFEIALNPFTISADSIDKDNKRVNIYAKSKIEPYGQLNVVLSMDPKDSTYFDLNYHLEKFPATVLNPYLISQTSYPLDRGTIELKGNWNVRNSKIQSKNNMTLLDPRFSQKINNKLTRWIPMKILMLFVKERGNVIDYDIPITGDLKDPKFHLRDVIWDVIKNIFVKPVTTTYGMQVKTVETTIEKSLSINWEMRQADLKSNEERFLKSMVNFLDDNPEAIIEVTPQYYEEKEKEYILFFEAKKKYFAEKNNLKLSENNTIKLDERDSVKIDKMSIKDSLFLAYLDKQINDSLMFTVQEKCARFVGPKIIQTKYNQLKKMREEKFLAEFQEKGLENRVKILPAKSVVPFNGFTYFEIDYEGDFPDKVKKAYQRMNQLNNQPPRDKYKDERT